MPTKNYLNPTYMTLELNDHHFSISLQNCIFLFMLYTEENYVGERNNEKKGPGLEE